MTAPQQRDIKPRYEIERLRGEIEVEILEPEVRTIKKGTKEFVSTTWKRVKKMVPAGFMVYLANRGSYRVKDEAELTRLELDVPPDLVDMETGEIVPRVEPVSLKRQVERSVRPTRKMKPEAATEAVEASTKGV